MKAKDRPSNFRNEDVNPCIKESETAQQCIITSEFGTQSCLNEIKIYNDCKKFWSAIMKSRQNNGIKPFMPNRTEREKIMEQRNKGKKVIASP